MKVHEGLKGNSPSPSSRPHPTASEPSSPTWWKWFLPLKAGNEHSHLLGGLDSQGLNNESPPVHPGGGLNNGPDGNLKVLCVIQQEDHALFHQVFERSHPCKLRFSDMNLIISSSSNL